jgi:hypothetical protein
MVFGVSIEAGYSIERSRRMRPKKEIEEIVALCSID